MLDGVLLRYKHTQEITAMEETIQKQVRRIQELTNNQKKRFLRIYFHSSHHLVVDGVVQKADPE
jgi:hypothetical protein